MKLLVIGTDVSMFRDGTDARERLGAYGRLFDELHVIIYTPRGFTPQALTSGARLYPTNSRWFLVRPLDAARLGRRIIRAHGTDLISVQDPAESGLAGWLLKRSTGLLLHVQLHADFFSRHFRRNSWKEWLRYWLARFIVPRGDAFRVVSQRIADSLSSKFKIQKSKITVLPIFVDRERIVGQQPAFNLRKKYPEFDFIILMVSRLVREKNFRLALEAFAGLLREFPRTGLVIVGDGPEHEKLKVKSDQLRIAASVRFEGWQEDLVSYYKTADLYLLTSNFEGYSRSVVEAAAAGLPVVMTDVGVAGDVIRDRLPSPISSHETWEGETGRVVPVGDREALVRALLGARRDYRAMQRMAERARAEGLALAPRNWDAYLERYRTSFAPRAAPLKHSQQSIHDRE